MLYFDESGYTGPDLINPEQPYFILASIRLTDDEVASIKDDIAYTKFGREMHFKNMYTNYEGREMLERIFLHPTMDSNHILLSYAEKRYCIYANIVNTLVETYYHKQGINLYKGGKHLYLANALYYSAFLHQDKALISDFEAGFVYMMRDPSPSSIQYFYELADKLKKNEYTTQFFSEMLSLVLLTDECIEEALPATKFSMDLTISLFSMMIQEWYKRTGLKEDVRFDSSEPFYANKSLLEGLKDMKIPETEVGSGISKHVYPFPVGEMRIAQSHSEFGIQLADVYASALNFILTPRRDKFSRYQEELSKLPIFQSIDLNVMPLSPDELKTRMEERLDIDPIEFLCHYWENTN